MRLPVTDDLTARINDEAGDSRTGNTVEAHTRTLAETERGVRGG